MSERTREPDRTVPERERRSSGSNSQAAGQKRPPQSTGGTVKRKQSADMENGRRSGTSERDRRAGTSERDRRAGTSERDRRAGTSERDRKPGTSERDRRAGTSAKGRKPGAVERSKRPGTASERNRRPSDRDSMDYDSHMSSRELERARRREERLRRVRRQKIIMAASATVIVLCLLTILIFFMSPAKCILSVSRGDKYARNEEYDKALEAYQEAIEINEKSVRAYRGAAGCLRMKEQITEAEQLLYKGWEKTKDEGILRYYNKLLLNEAVADINAGNCTQTTLDKLNRVLMNDPENLDAIALLDTCQQRMAGEE